MARSFKKNYVLADPASQSAWQLLCSWDFSITSERTVRQRKNNLRVQLKVTVYVFQSNMGGIYIHDIFTSKSCFHDKLSHK